MPPKKTNAMLAKEITELQASLTTMTETFKDFSILVNGSEKFGIEGIRARQKKDDEFKEFVSEKLKSLGSEFFNQYSHLKEEVHTHTAEIKNELQEDMKKVLLEADEKTESLRKEIADVKDWKKSWDTAITLMTSSTVWKVVFLIGFAFVGLFLWFKFQIWTLLK
jgi:hypothetical protein